MPKQNKLHQINKLVETAHVSLESARQLLRAMVGDDDVPADVADKVKEVGKVVAAGGEKIIEGVFDGQNMVGPDGKQYSIPANYASKSKLVQGDTLKLTIMADGSFMYKQIGPVERSRLVGLLARDETSDEYRVVVGERSYKVLLASITYFKGESGDEVVILTPKDKDSDWAAVENIIKVPADGSAPEAAPVQKTPPAVEEIEELNS